jgi:TRAP-type C4-dicarboxylate transport system permease small subunit
MRFWRLVMRVIGDFVPVVLIVITTTVIALDVGARTIFNRPLFAASEIALIAFVWLVWLGTVGVARRDEMMGITFFRDRLGPLKRPAEILSDLLIVAMCGYIVYATWRQVSTARFTVFDQLPLPKWILAVGVGVSMALLLLIFLGRLWLALRGRGEEAERPSGMLEP